MTDNRVTYKFAFDAIVTHLETFNLKKIDIQKLSVIVEFYNIKLIIPASRINVTEFQSGFGVEFSAEITNIQRSLEVYGLSLSINYKNDLLGVGQINIPQNVLDSIENDKVDLLQSNTCNFHRSGIVQGTIEVMWKLTVKYDCVDRGINPADIMFLIAQSQRYSIPNEPCCNVLESEEYDERLKLDLQRYASFNARAAGTADSFLHNPFGNAICSELKKFSQDCTHTIESILKKSGMSSSSKLSSQRAKESKSSQCQSSNRTEKVDLPLMKNTRYCPVCLHNLSWLPRFATCPKCGVKPKPVIEKREERELSVEQILKDYLTKPSSTPVDCSTDPNNSIAEDNTNMEQRAKSRCTCKPGKLCAHCRIRKLCADILPSTDTLVSYENSQFSKSVSDTSKKKSDPDKSQDSRPFLTRVFSELRDLYDIKSASPLQERDKKCLKNPISNNSHQIRKEPPKYDQQRSLLTEDKTSPYPQHSLIRKKNKVGHKHCAKKLRAVSRRHGWAWSSSREARKYGWRPGAVSKPIKKLMDFFLKTPSTNTYIHNSRICQMCPNGEQRLPVLNVCKKNGEILITLRSLNNSHTNTKPIVFKIGKSELAVALREIKRKLKDMGFRKCTCHKSIMLCVCRNIMEKKHLESAVQKECRQRRMQNCVDQLVLSDTSDSEMDFDFQVTPSAGLAKPTPLLQKTTINHSTQTSNVLSELPDSRQSKKSIKPYWRTYDGATGDRYTGTAFGRPGEVVFEDGVFGLRGGGPHGASATPGGKPKTESIWGARPGGLMRRSEGVNSDNKLGGIPFPGAKNKSEAARQHKWIPVRMPQRYYKAINAAKLQQEALEREASRRKCKSNMMKYLSKAYNSYKQNIGLDGLTDAQRRHKSLFYTSVPPLDTIPRLGRSYAYPTMGSYDNNRNSHWCSYC